MPVPVLKSRFSQISKKLLDIISTYADKDGTSILKSVSLTVLCIKLMLPTDSLVAVLLIILSSIMFDRLKFFLTHSTAKNSNA